MPIECFILLDASVVALGAAVLTGILSVSMLVLFLMALDTEPVSIHSRWSGLGGGLGGWTMSLSLVFLAGALFFGAATAVVAVQYLQSQQTAAQREFELQKAKEADERRYQDADKARTMELEKARLAAIAR